MTKRVLVWTGGTEASHCAALADVKEVHLHCASDRSSALAAMGDVEGFIASTVYWDPHFASRLRDTHRLVWIQLLNAGFDNMERLGVPARVTVTTVGGIGSSVVAEHAIALLLALLHGLPVAFDAQRRAEWSPQHVASAARTLRGLQLGVVGCGHIGGAVAALAQGLGARVVGFARTARRSRNGLEVRPLEALRASLGTLEGIILCAPLNATTEKLIDTSMCAAMRPGSFLVNISRGGLVDTDALTQALQSRILAGAALDVVAPEPLPPSHPLWSLPNVLITPHTAWAGADASHAEQLRDLLVENLRRFARGETLRNVAPMRYA